MMFCIWKIKYVVCVKSKKVFKSFKAYDKPMSRSNRSLLYSYMDVDRTKRIRNVLLGRLATRPIRPIEFGFVLF